MNPPPAAAREVAARNLLSITPFFIVADLQASVAHYLERFGFTLEFQGPPDDVYYAQVRREGAAIMLKTILPDVHPCPNHTRHPWARWDAYIYSRDPELLFEEFKQRGASFVKELCYIDDGLWGFEVTDADGYVLAFFHLRRAHYRSFVVLFGFDLPFRGPGLLGEAEELATLGRREEARARYRDFLALYADSDPRFEPLLRRARQALAPAAGG